LRLVRLSAPDGGLEAHCVGTGFNTRVVYVEPNQQAEDSIHVDAAGRVGLGMHNDGPPTASLDVNGDTLRLRETKPEAPSSAEGEVGEIRLVADANGYRIYVKVASGLWESGVLS